MRKFLTLNFFPCCPWTWTPGRSACCSSGVSRRFLLSYGSQVIASILPTVIYHRRKQIFCPMVFYGLDFFTLSLWFCLACPSAPAFPENWTAIWTLHRGEGRPGGREAILLSGAVFCQQLTPPGPLSVCDGSSVNGAALLIHSSGLGNGGFLFL